mmetsp:Transcript_68993/g.214174  ORF Transcript_68993/g.214174 Transcript_68993/m.214174 type:complete len:213 (+) Transcript_68993:114-752(+)
MRPGQGSRDLAASPRHGRRQGHPLEDGHADRPGIAALGGGKVAGQGSGEREPTHGALGQAGDRRRQQPDRCHAGRAHGLAPSRLRLQGRGQRGEDSHAGGPGGRLRHPGGKGAPAGGGHSRPATQRAALRDAAEPDEGEEETHGGHRSFLLWPGPHTAVAGAAGGGAAREGGRQEGRERRRVAGQAQDGGQGPVNATGGSVTSTAAARRAAW